MSQAAVGFGRRGKPSPLQQQSEDGTFKRRRAALERSSATATAAVAEQPIKQAAARASLPADVDEIDMLRYIGGNWPKFRSSWYSMQSSGQPYAQSFCWPAFFFGPFWLLYRKQYATGFAMFAIGMATMFISPELNKWVMFGIGIALAIFGKSLVVNSGTRTIQNIKSLQLAPTEEAMRIERAGGASWTPVVLPFVLLMFIVYVVGSKVRPELPQVPADTESINRDAGGTE